MPNHLQLAFDLQYACPHAIVPAESTLEYWLNTTLSMVPENKVHSHTHIMLSLRVVDKDEIQALNHQYRNKNKPTNVLSFPNIEPDITDADYKIFAQHPEDEEEYYLGDIIICAPIIEQEAAEQNKALEHHWAHMIVHGVLHLLGYDHILEAQAQEMESLEISILQKMGFPNPYIPYSPTVNNEKTQ